MNKVSLKKYTVFALVCFLSFMSFCLADNKILFGVETPFISFSDYRDLTCSADAPSDAFELIKKDGVGYSVKFARIPSSDGTFDVTCTYKTDTGTGEKKFNWYYKLDDLETSYSFSLDNWDGSSKTTDIAAELGVKEVLSFNLQNGSEYLDENCPVGGSTCTVTLSNAPITDNVTVSGTLVYKPEGYDIKITSHINIYIYKSAVARAVPGTYGTCNFDSTYWDKEGMYYFSKGLNGIVFPSCTPRTENDPLLEFVGWSEVHEKGHQDQSLSGSCATNGTIVNGQTNVQPAYFYFACYKRGNGIAIYANGATLQLDDGWVKAVSGAYYKKSTDNVVLPNATYEGAFNATKTFEGWRKSNSSDTSIYPAGSSVPADGSSYVAVYSSERVVREYNKTIYIGENKLLSPYGVKVTGCSSSNTGKVLVVSNSDSGECILQGVEATDENQSVDVTVFGENEYQKVFHITVVSRYGRTNNGDSSFVVNVVPNVISTYNDYTTLNGYQTDSCNEYNYTGHGDVTLNDGYATNSHVDGKISIYYLTSTCDGDGKQYYSLCLDAGRNSPESGYDHNSSYSRTEDIAMNSDFGRLLDYMGTSGLFARIKNGDDAAVLSANVAIRIVSILDNLSLSDSFNASDTTHAEAYEYYENLADKFRYHLTSDEKIDPNGVDEALADSDLIGEVKPTVADIMKNYQYAELSEGGSFFRTIDDVKYVVNGNDIEITYIGTITVPGTGTSVEAHLEGYSVDGLKGTVKKFQLNTEKSNSANRSVYDYEVLLEIDATKLEIPSSSNQSTVESAVSAKEESKKISFKLTYKASGTAISDAFIAEPSGTLYAGTKQRLVVINPDDVTIYVYFSPAVQSSDCRLVPQLNPDNCMDESCGDITANGSFRTTDSFNPSLFKASGCCNLLTDESKYSYLMENICSSVCTTSTMPAVCDYRSEYTGSADMYEIHEGSDSEGNYKIGGNKSCIVYTDAFEGLVGDHEDLTTRYDDSGNSLMVEAFKDNRYCRISCSEDWELAMDSFGNYLGENAVAAGSYFQSTKNDMFVRGKRTCYTTFIDYGSYEVEGNLGSFNGFTKDLAVESDKIITAYNAYSAISHVYSDLAGGNDSQYFEKPSYVGVDATHKYCVKTDGEKHYYCDSGDSLDSSSHVCTHTKDADEDESSGSQSCSSWTDPRGSSITGSLDDGTCSYTYDALTYNKCASDGWAYCITYSLSTSNGFNDEDKCDNNGDGSGDEETDAGEYCHNEKDSNDGLNNAQGGAKSKATPYADIDSYSKGQGLRSGEFIESELDLSFVYDSDDEARADLADDDGMDANNYNGDRSGNTENRLGTGTAECTGTGNSSTATVYDGISVSINVNLNEYISGVTKDDPEECKADYDAKCNTISTGDIDRESANKEVSVPGCGGGKGNCDDSFGASKRQQFMEQIELEQKMNDYAKDMQRANNNIVDYAEDMFACQHFELYNSYDSTDNGLNNNQLSTAKMMGGSVRQFTKIVSSFNPSISYAYDELEYMTILMNDNVMERFKRLNSEFYNDEYCENKELDENDNSTNCYNDATNSIREIRINGYANGGTDRQYYNTVLARNYLELFYYDNNNRGEYKPRQIAWDPTSLAAISYGHNLPEADSKLTCGGIEDCDFGDQLQGLLINENEYGAVTKRTLLCYVGKVVGSSWSSGDAVKGGDLRKSVIRDKSPFWSAGECYVSRVNYIQANYIKASIDNSSYYKNKGYWYTNDSDVKEHGDNKVDALRNAAERKNGVIYAITTEETDKWSVLGSYNVFPIKMTTPRDIYQYTYTFADIGSYSAGNLGRIMGSDQSLISTNNRTCFYEVYEEICLCCGNPINAHYSNAGIVDTDEWVESNTPYTPSDKDFDSDYLKSTLAFTTSTVSLSDMKSDSDRKLGNNWGTDSKFFYSGEEFTTNKGAELLREITSVDEGQGDNIYSETPEYSYTLTPSGLASIRDYNDKVGYELNHNNLKNVAKYSMVPYDLSNYTECNTISGCGWEIPSTTDETDYRNNHLITIQHYSSKFLSDTIAGYGGVTVNDSLYGANSVTMREDCYVTEGFTASQMDELQKNCRWVDYIQHDEDSNRYFRLAFK